MTSRRLLDPVSKTLLDAADYIEEHGWCQEFMWADGRVCALGAILIAKGTGLSGPRDRLMAFLKNPESITKWNDAPGRTKDEVVSALREAALMEVSTKKE